MKVRDAIGWLKAVFCVVEGMLWAKYRGYDPVSIQAFWRGLAILAIIHLIHLSWITFRFWLKWISRPGKDAHSGDIYHIQDKP